DTETDDGRLIERAIAHARLAELVEQAARHAEDAAVFAHVFAHHHHVGIPPHFFANAFVKGLRISQSMHAASLLLAKSFTLYIMQILFCKLNGRGSKTTANLL